MATRKLSPVDQPWRETTTEWLIVHAASVATCEMVHARRRWEGKSGVRPLVLTAARNQLVIAAAARRRRSR